MGGGGGWAHPKFYYVDPPLFVHPDNEILDSGCPEDQIHHQLWPDNFVSIWNIIKERSICFVDIMTIRHSLFYLCVGDPNPCNSPKNVVPIMKTCSSCFQRNFWYLLLTSVLLKLDLITFVPLKMFSLWYSLQKDLGASELLCWIRKFSRPLLHVWIPLVYFNLLELLLFLMFSKRSATMNVYCVLNDTKLSRHNLPNTRKVQFYLSIIEQACYSLNCVQTERQRSQKRKRQVSGDFAFT